MIFGGFGDRWTDIGGCRAAFATEKGKAKYTNLHNKVLTPPDELILCVNNGLKKSEILK